MRKAIRGSLFALAGIVLIGGGLFFSLLYTPTPTMPKLTGTFASRKLTVGGLKRTYLVYVPAYLPKSAPLVIALHGSDGSAATLRRETGYAFERLADKQHFALVYPEAFEGNWNACNRVGDYAANRRNIDDVGFIETIASQVVAKYGLASGNVFAAGVSRGGQMAYRLAIEAPSRFAAVAAVAASLPAPQNFKCRLASSAPSPVLVMNGTDDPLNPFAGGEVTLFGMYKRGVVISSRATGQYFANLAGVVKPPRVIHEAEVDRYVWENMGVRAVELLAVRGGGHVLPQPYVRAPRLLGLTIQKVDGPGEIWKFYETHKVQELAAHVKKAVPAV